MKKISTAIFVLTFSLLLVGCSSASHEKPDYLTDEQYEAALQVVEIFDKYLDSDLSSEEAYEDISNVSSSWDDMESTEDGDSKASLLGTKIFSLEQDLFGGTTSDKSMTKARNEIADMINEDQK